MAPPLVLSIVPPVMTKAPVADPRAEALLILSVPALSVVPPVKLLAFESVRLAAPSFTKPPVPIMEPPLML